MKRKIMIVAALLALCLAFSMPALASWNDYCLPAPVNTGAMDVKVNAVQGATGVAGVVQVNTCAYGVKTVNENVCEVQGNGGVAGNLIGKTGAVAIGDFDASLTTTKTNVSETYQTTTNQYTVQNVASMNQQVIASATNAGMQGNFTANGAQTFTQAVVSAGLPGGGVVNSSYVGAQSYNIVGK